MNKQPMNGGMGGGRRGGRRGGAMVCKRCVGEHRDGEGCPAELPPVAGDSLEGERHGPLVLKRRLEVGAELVKSAEVDGDGLRAVLGADGVLPVAQPVVPLVRRVAAGIVDRCHEARLSSQQALCGTNTQGTRR